MSFYHYKNILLIILLIQSFAIGQSKTKPILKQYNFGKAMYVGDDNVHSWDKRFGKIGVINKDGKYLITQKKFDSQSFLKLIFNDTIKEIFLKDIKLILVQTEYLDEKLRIIKPSIFAINIHANNVILSGCYFSEGINFQSIESYGCFDLTGNYYKKYLLFGGCNFMQDTTLLDFFSYFKIQGAKLENSLHFLSSTFHVKSDFIDTKVFGQTIFTKCIFNENVNFKDINFHRSSSFEECTFNKNISFERVVFHDTLNFYHTIFSNGIDLRRCYFDSLKSINLEKCEYPIGKFYIDWEEIKYRDKPIISIDTSFSKSNEDDFKRLEIIYDQLIHNYEAQGNKISVDDVRYELEIRRQELLGGITHWVYGKILGYGYKPFRYLLYLVIPLISFFAFILYVYHYEIVYELLKPSYSNKTQMFKLERGKYLKNNFIISDGYVNKFKIPKIAVLWHCLFMSSSLLLGLRFKKDWINYKENKFLILASIEWLIGIGLYVGFALLVKTFRFEFLKGIFGI